MPVQPLKAVALIVITQKVSGAVIFGGGLAIGLTMLILTVTGLLAYMNRVIPKTVIRGIQFGLGMQLCLLSLKDYIPDDFIQGYILALAAFALGLVFIGNKKVPPALIIILLGILYSVVFNFSVFGLFAFQLPAYTMPEITMEHVVTGFVLLALPQIPLSLGNSVFATHQLIKDYFPERKVSVGKIGLTYSIMNIVGSFFGGLPACHGSGGIAGHYTFGGRTGGSTFIYGLFYIFLGLFIGHHPQAILSVFPKPILGVILLFEGIALMLLLKDIITDRRSFFIALVVGLLANGLPYGYLAGIVVGTILFYLPKTWLSKHFGR
jgi:xanthine/uracil/vitamin C permease (AzgA family)